MCLLGQVLCGSMSEVDTDGHFGAKGSDSPGAVSGGGGEQGAVRRSAYAEAEPARQ
jgi:hypothetical protein